ncbi:MAG: LSU ribosomal protein L28p [Brockia lithotrophica]|uniref:Large ribosomal subunit protein bL28 n=1 Tax=Brockia lithotrophica TaxID=933949 RepID=A0A2T5G6B1_9BACL|nr:50S ribosomal protein L28 [Brockia lithotrophica]MBT9252416.1 50S ribosomal protein L28 [Brockia lithotrophica]MBT9253928.1 50S ribosomal protein L28 [Brockia lithotrophica]MBT9253931.1 50S ribosomal protein L28 [Brockia lithotrophica]PTQ51718.1 MAG: LSU ribosomal protein L28p [Brockia lithotrophica]
MGRVCHVTGKKPMFGNRRSHSMKASRRKFSPNLKKVRILVDGKPKRVWVHVKALKKGLVQRV